MDPWVVNMNACNYLYNLSLLGILQKGSQPNGILNYVTSFSIRSEDYRAQVGFEKDSQDFPFHLYNAFFGIFCHDELKIPFWYLRKELHLWYFARGD